MSLSAALAHGAEALQVFTAGLNVAGGNVANAATPGYAREELRLEAGFPHERGGQLVGTGVRAAGVRRAVDARLETRLHAAAGEAAGAGAAADLYARLDATLGELTDGDLSTALSDFSAAVDRVVTEPDSGPLRAALIDEGAALAADFRSLRSRADDLSNGLLERAGALTEEANGLLGEVNRLNERIVRLERGGLANSDAGGLRDQRFAAVSRLAEIIPLQVSEVPTGAVELRSGSDWLILGSSVQTLELGPPDPDGPAPGVPTLRTSRTRSPLPAGGELGGALGAAEEVIGGFVEDLDVLAAGLIETVNRVHAGGRGSHGHAAVTGLHGVADAAAPLDAAANLGADALPFAPRHGAFTLSVANAATGAEAATRIEIDLDGLGGNDTTLASLAATLDAVDGVGAAVDVRGRLTLSAADGRELHFGDDTSGVLAALGVGAFFAGTDAGSIAVAAPLKADPGLLAVGRGGGPADNANALALAHALAAPVSGGQSGPFAGRTLDELWAGTAAAVARGSAGGRALADGAAAHHAALLGQREQVSGVSLDEEAVRILELQRQYQATARVIGAVDELFNTLVNL